MLRPSYSELMEVLNQDRELDSKITSRYTIVIAAAKRARQIVNGAACDNSLARTDKAVSIAISELERGLIKLYPDGLPESYTDVTPETVNQDASNDEELFIGDEFDDYDDLDSLSEDLDGLSAMEDYDDEFDDEYYDDGANEEHSDEDSL